MTIKKSVDHGYRPTWPNDLLGLGQWPGKYLDVSSASGISTVWPSGACASLTLSGMAMTKAGLAGPRPSQIITFNYQNTLIGQSNILLKQLVSLSSYQVWLCQWTSARQINFYMSLQLLKAKNFYIP